MAQRVFRASASPLQQQQKPHLLGLPHLQHGHASDDGVGVFLRGRVHGVIGTDHQGQVGLWSAVGQEAGSIWDVPVFRPKQLLAEATSVTEGGLLVWTNV